MPQPLIILGTGGNALDLLDVIESINRVAPTWEVAGHLDDTRAPGSSFEGAKILGRLDDASSFANCSFVNAIGSDKSYRHRSEIIARTKLPLDRFATLVHASASVSSRAKLGPGTCVNAGVIVAGGVAIGAHVWLGSGCVLGHDVLIEDFAVVSPQAVLSGFVKVGQSAYVGAGASVRQQVTIGERALVGLGGVVVKDVLANTTVVGNPARRPCSRPTAAHEERMSSAITVSNVSKRFTLGVHGTHSYGTLRESVVTGVRNAGRWFARKLRLIKRDENTDADLWAVKDVSFNVAPGEVIGVVGRNGAGKSTLLKILSRITAPTEGEILIRGRVGSLLEVGTGFHPELTGRENVYLNGSILGMSRREIARKFDEIVAFAEVERFLDTPVKRYSSGMYVRLAFAVAAHLEPEVLLVDEVLAVGDMAFQKKCLGKMGQVSRQGRTILFVSHNMTAVKALCSRAVLLEGGRLAADGSVDDVVNRYLTGGLDTANTGIITEQAPRHSDRPGTAYFRSVRLLDLADQPVTQVYFGQPFRVQFECDILKEMPDGLFEVSISTQDGIHVSQSTTLDGGASPRRLAVGRHTGTATFSGLTLLPRAYTIDLGIHHWDGMTADFVQRTFDFTVLRMAENGNDHYPWPITRGCVRGPVTWEQSVS